MSDTAIPPVFVSHGGPNIILEDKPASRFLRSFAQTHGRPKAILSVSAHFESSIPAFVSDPAPGMIYDFGGFPDELYSMVYAAPGAPELAERAANLLVGAGIRTGIVPRRGYDHGTWVPLKMMYPEADIPVLQLSVQPHEGPAHHLAVGKALAALRREGVLIFASGSFTHNLREVFGVYRGRAPSPEVVPDWTREFVAWMTDRLETGAVEDLLDYRARAPHAVRNHPTDEHLLPLYVALGAAEGEPVERIHASVEMGMLAMDAFRFGAKAA